MGIISLLFIELPQLLYGWRAKLGTDKTRVGEVGINGKLVSRREGVLQFFHLSCGAGGGRKNGETGTFVKLLNHMKMYPDPS